MLLEKAKQDLEIETKNMSAFSYNYVLTVGEKGPSIKVKRRTIESMTSDVKRVALTKLMLHNQNISTHCCRVELRSYTHICHFV